VVTFVIFDFNGDVWILEDGFLSELNALERLA